MNPPFQPRRNSDDRLCEDTEIDTRAQAINALLI